MSESELKRLMSFLFCGPHYENIQVLLHATLHEENKTLPPQILSQVS